MHLTPGHHAALYSCISTILRESQSELHSTQDVSASVRAVASVAHTACADFASAFNSSSAVNVLPVEVLCMVFGFLDFTGRIRASQVCRMWRTVSLGNPSLWKDIVIPTRTPSQIDTLSTVRCFELLHRSNPMEFHLVLDAPQLLDGSMTLDRVVLSLMKQHLHRLASYLGPLDLAVQSLGLLETPLPKLHTLRLTPITKQKSFSLHLPECVFEIPSHWSGDGAPRLRRLELGEFSFAPECRAIRALEHFSGRLSGDNSAGASLFRHFPRLKTLELHVESRTAALPDAPLPASLHTLSIFSGTSPLDADRLAPYLHSAGVRRLTVNKLKIIEPFVRWFSTSHSGAFSMFFASFELVLASADGCYDYTAVLYDCRGICGGLAPHLLLLERLVLEGYTLWDICRSGLTMPNVRLLQIVVREYLDAASWPTIMDTGPPARMPALQRLDLAWLPRSGARADETMPLLFKYLPRHFRSCVLYDAPLLQRLTLTLSVAPPDGEPSFHRLEALAEDFVVLRRYDLGYDPAEYAHLQNFPQEPLILP